LFVGGRAGVVPAVIDRDGIMPSFAFDSYDYQRGAIKVAGLLRARKLVQWATAAEPAHVKIIAIPFAVLGPLFGYSTLSAEPYNLACYAAILGLVFALGEEVGGRRVGILAGAIVALWPTFLLHTLQLLKDPLFVTATLAFLLCVITWLTRTYGRSASIAVSILAILLLLLLCLVRINFMFLIIAVVLVALTFLVIRQAMQRRLLFWNLAPPVAVLITALLLMPFYLSHTSERIKHYPSDQSGPLKIDADSFGRVPTTIVRISGPETNQAPPGEQRTSLEKVARRISSVRSRFAAAYYNSGSLLDSNTEFRTASDLLAYLPRAVAVGLWAPFPDMWISAGQRVGNAGKLLSGIETLVIYLLQVLAVVAIVREPRRLALWFLLAIVIVGVTALAFVVPNVGAIYRFRYVFWMMLVVTAMTGLDSLRTPRRSVAERTFIAQRRKGAKRYRVFERFRRLTITFVAACLLSAMYACSSPSHASLSQKGALNFALTNFTGTSLRAIYLSPSASTAWEENIMAGAELKDGDTVNIRFDPNEKNIDWDMRIEGVDGHYAEWKNLKLGGIAEVTLMLKLSPEPAVTAEIE
ncbi:MAG TPA: hypothetical protein VEV42_16255, partial [Pyrinomonadaceae bacterium]|nr:hypothetical protein [Pyrinomonadaceae bacterium]